MTGHNDPVAALTHEHEFIGKVVDALGRLASSSNQAERADPETLREIVQFMREFADRCHHAKEEDLLFPAIEKKAVPESVRSMSTGGPWSENLPMLLRRSRYGAQRWQHHRRYRKRDHGASY